MFREMRRKDRILSAQDTERLLQTGEYGILSTVGEDAYPYGIPVNYVYSGRELYFHCAVTGSKLDNIAENPKISFCVVGRTQVLPGQFTTNYESAVVFGRAQEVSGEEKQHAMELLLQKYSPDFFQSGLEYLQKADSRVKVIKIQTEHMSGKSRK